MGLRGQGHPPQGEAAEGATVETAAQNLLRGKQEATKELPFQRKQQSRIVLREVLSCQTAAQKVTDNEEAAHVTLGDCSKIEGCRKPGRIINVVINGSDFTQTSGQLYMLFWGVRLATSKGTNAFQIKHHCQDIESFTARNQFRSGPFQCQIYKKSSFVERKIYLG